MTKRTMVLQLAICFSYEFHLWQCHMVMLMILLGVTHQSIKQHYRRYIWTRNCLPFRGTWVHPLSYGGIHVAHPLVFLFVLVDFSHLFRNFFYIFVKRCWFFINLGVLNILLVSSASFLCILPFFLHFIWCKQYNIY